MQGVSKDKPDCKSLLTYLSNTLQPQETTGPGIFTEAFLLREAMLSASFTAGVQGEGLDLFNLSLDELMNISMVSAPKEEERLFDAPAATYSLSREEASKAGVLSISEALRLTPGILVRKTTNGNYDIK